MNRKLQLAEERLLELLRHHGPLSIDEIFTHLREEGESELRAAVWTLRAEGMVDFDDGKLKAEAVEA